MSPAGKRAGVAIAACSGCGGRLVGRANFCPHCGRAVRRVGPSGGTSDGERKLISILFADLCDSLTLIERRDPEEAHALLEDVVQVMRGEAHRFGGTVTEILGDGIVVLFGAPVALEAHADRAVWAGLAMVDALRSYAEAHGSAGGALALRVGIASGEVVLDTRKADTGSSYAATGETPHLAARLQKLARRNGVCVADGTRRLLVEPFVCEAVTGVSVAGLSQPVTIHHVTGWQAPNDRGRARPHLATLPLVGRERELAQLGRALADAAALRPTCLRIVGEAGVGKSRVVGEIAQRQGANGWLVLSARGQALAPGAAWGVLAQTLHAALDLPRDADAEARQAAIEALAPVVSDKAALQAVLQLAPAGPSWEQASGTERVARIGAAFATFLAARAAARPLLLVVDDAHEVDAATAAVLAELPARLSRAAIAVVATCRPGSDRLAGGVRGWRSVRLRPLPQPAARSLLDRMLGPSPTLTGLKQRLIRHTGGRPLFLEELVRELVDRSVLRQSAEGWTLDRPIDSLPLPASVRSTLQSRVDRLAPQDREILRAAAVIGEAFDTWLVANVVDLPHARVMARLARLATLEFLARRSGDGRLRDSPRYGFRHSLIREAVYSSILRSRQVDLHRRVVSALDMGPAASQDPERDTFVAQHCFAAGLWQRAASAYGVLAERALMRSAPAAADEACSTALAALDRLGDTGDAPIRRVRLLLVAGDAAFARADHAAFAARVSEAAALAERIADVPSLISALSSQCLHAWTEGRLAAAVDLAERCHALAIAAQDVDLPTTTAVRLGFMLQARGHYARSIDLFAWALARIPDERRFERFGLAPIPLLACHASAARSLAELDRASEAERHAATALELADRAGHPFSSAYVAREIGLSLIRQDRSDRAIAVLRRGLDAAEAAGLGVLLPALQSALGHALALGGRPGRGLPLLEKAARVAVANGLRVRLSQQLGWLADAQARLGHAEQARQTALEALGWARRCGELGHEGWILRLLATLGVRLDGEASPLELALRLARAEGLATLERACRTIDPRGSAAGDRVLAI